jgi:hypothetical protein
MNDGRGDMDVSASLRLLGRILIFWLCLAAVASGAMAPLAMAQESPKSPSPEPGGGGLNTSLVKPANASIRLGVSRERGGLERADTVLRRVYAEYRAYQVRRAKRPFQPSSRHVVYRDGFVMVEAVARHHGRTLEAELSALGLQDVARYKDNVAGMLPVSQIEAAASLGSLRSLSASYPPVNRIGDVTSQGDVALRADVARSMHTVDGTSLTIGVLSDSYDQGTNFPLTNAADDIASGDLPPGDPVVPGGAFEGCGTGLFGTPCTDEGRAMLQIVHDLAPGAALLFHTALNNSVRFAVGINTLVAVGADVIVDDVAYPNEPMFMDGIVAQAVDSAAAAGVSYISAAGNAARKSYEGGFDDSGEELCIEIIPDGICDPIFELVGPMHDFDPGAGVDTLLSVTIPIGATIIAGLQWDDPFGNVETNDGPRRDHDITLLNAAGDTYYEIGGADNVINGSPVEVLTYTNIGGTTDFALAVTYDATDSLDPPTDFFKIVVFATSGVTINEFQTNSSTVVGHANAAGATATGAAFWGDTPEFGQAPALLEPYSSAGGTPILYDTGGDALPFAIVRDKPDITAVDGVSNTFFGSPDGDGDSYPDFFGTSAAAPHAAAIAALILEANPGLSPSNVNTLLRTTALDMEGPGFDYESGFGLVQADAAVGAALSVEACVAGPQPIPAGQWNAFSLPCDAAPESAVTDVFPGLNPAAYGSGWEVFRHDAASDTDVPLAGSESLVQGTGYWILSDTATMLGVDGFAFSAADIPLVSDAVDGRLNHLGVPRSTALAWADVQVVDGAQVLSLDQADPLDGGTLECSQMPLGPNCRMSRIMYKWNGGAYQAFDGVTPGMEGTLSPLDAFVVRAYKSGIGLRIQSAEPPAVEAVSGSPGDWQVRLVAESGSMEDAGNVLGQLSTADERLDTHDLEELAPFGNTYLSILFTNPRFPAVDWGFTSDFRAPTIKPAGEWPFVVRASDDVDEVTLRWEGDPAQLNVAWLVDMQTGLFVRTEPGGSYTFPTGAQDREFKFVIYQR